MPPEWYPHAATHIGWPYDDEWWVGQLAGARKEFAELIATIAVFEPVLINVHSQESHASAEEHLQEAVTEVAGRDYGRPVDEILANISYFKVPINDIWFRDNGPIFVVNEQGEVAGTDWEFNAWGGKFEPWRDDNAAAGRLLTHLRMMRFDIPVVLEGGAIEVNGEGVLITTRSCLLTDTRNPHLTEKDNEEVLRDHLGVERVVWLDKGMEFDHTDGHIDTIVRFASDKVLVCTVTDDEADPSYVSLRRNLERLQQLKSSDGAPYRVVTLPLPKRHIMLEGERVAASYANFYIGNGFVVVPMYDDERDAEALEILKPLFPGRRVIGLPSSHIATGGGSFHCITQQRPVGEVHNDAS